jgi:hypothetical protein
MSLAVARAEIATAASTVAGVNVTPYFRQITKAGQGFMKLDRIEYPNNFGGVAYFAIWVVIPADTAAAEKRFEDLEPLLKEALKREWIHDSSLLEDLALDQGGQLPVLQLIGHREITS